MSTMTMKRVKRKLAALTMAGMLFQLGSCNFDDITTTTTTTLNTRDVLVTLLRSWIITPIDNYLTDRIDSFVDTLSDEDE